MKFINNLTFYEDCREALIECYGDIDIAVEYLHNRKYGDTTIYVLKESLLAVNEGLGDKIINALSKKLGGSISKIDPIVNKMNKAESTFVEREYQIESEYIKLFREFVHLKYRATDKSKMGPVQSRLQELESQMRQLIRSYNTIMDELEKQIDILTRSNNRRADYYNIKRAKHSVEAKEKRATYKYNLVKYIDTPEVAERIDNVFGSADDAKKDAEEAQSNAEQMQAKISKYDPGPEWKSIVFKEAEAKMKDAHIICTKYKNSIYDMVKEEELTPAANKSEHSKKESSFNSKKTTAIKRIELKISGVNSLAPDNASDQLKNAVQYYSDELNKIKADVDSYKFPAYQGIIKKKKKKKPATASNKP